MKKLFASLIVAATLVLAISCTSSRPIAVNGPIGAKRGESTNWMIAGVIFLGNGDILDAAKDGGISNVSTVDIRTTNYLGLVIKNVTVVSGE